VVVREAKFAPLGVEGLGFVGGSDRWSEPGDVGSIGFGMFSSGRSGITVGGFCRSSSTRGPPVDGIGESWSAGISGELEGVLGGQHDDDDTCGGK
jgi:hypothetical protein